MADKESETGGSAASLLRSAVEAIVEQPAGLGVHTLPFVCVEPGVS